MRCTIFSKKCACAKENICTRVARNLERAGAPLARQRSKHSGDILTSVSLWKIIQSESQSPQAPVLVNPVRRDAEELVLAEPSPDVNGPRGFAPRARKQFLDLKTY
jgi:hypothetical protein